MEFEAKFFGEKLNVVNPSGTVGIVTLWSPVDRVIARLETAGVDLAPRTSRIAVLGNLYGEGFRFLLRNLLYNPQIETVIVYGKALNDSVNYLPNFFEKGVLPYENEIEYVPVDGGAKPSPVRIAGTSYVMDDLVLPESFTKPPKILVEPCDDRGAARIKTFLDACEPSAPGGPRIFVDAPQVKVNAFPSDICGHSITARTPSAAWKLLVHRVFRFGKRVRLRKGERIELLNVKVVVEKPECESDEVIENCGFSPGDFRKYQEDILSSEKTFEYTYGNRIRAHFGADCLEIAREQLKEDLDDRKSFITLWDDKIDMTGAHSPCLVTLFFRKINRLLYMTATYRTHNVAKAWLENVYGLMAIQKFVAEGANLESGPLTVVSHSITLDPMYLEKMSRIHDDIAGKGMFNRDPWGYFRISLDEKEIVVKHYSPDGIMLDEHRGKNPLAIRRKLYRNCAISDINHAMYIGVELQKAWQCLQSGAHYTQDA